MKRPVSYFDTGVFSCAERKGGQPVTGELLEDAILAMVRLLLDLVAENPQTKIKSLPAERVSMQLGPLGTDARRAAHLAG